MKSTRESAVKENLPVVKFLFFAKNVRAGSLIGPEHVEWIQAAAARIMRQIEAASQASQSRTVKAGGRPRKPDSEVTPNALAQRRWRARRKK